MFFARLDADNLAWDRVGYYGGSQREPNTTTSGLGNPGALSGDVAIDSQDRIILTGVTNSADLPLVNPLPYSRQGIATAFVARVEATGLGLDFSTYISPAASNAGSLFYGVAVENGTDIVVVGSALSHVGYPLVDAQTNARGSTDPVISIFGDNDLDDDGIADAIDNCPLIANLSLIHI